MKNILVSIIAMIPYLLTQAQWEDDYRLTYDFASSQISFSSQSGIAISGHIVHIIWFDDRDGNVEIYYKRSIDDGISWSTDTRLTYDNNVSNWPSIAVSDSSVHIVWVDNRDGSYQIYYKNSSDNGITWGSDLRITTTTGNAQYPYPSIAVSGPFVHIVWSDLREGNSEIYYLSSPDSGITWDPETRLTEAPGTSAFPGIAISGNSVHVIWYDKRDNYYEIYYKRSDNNGYAWESDTQLTSDSAVKYTGSIAVIDSAVHVVWHSYRYGNGEICYKRSTDGGVEWEDDIRLTNDPGNSIFPSITANGSILHVVWDDNRDNNYELYYKCSLDQGSHWGQDTRLTYDFSDSYGASTALSDSTVHVVWYDNRDGNDEIYYKRNPTGNILVGTTDQQPVSYQNRIIVSPNPATDFLFCELNGLASNHILLVLSDLEGRTMFTQDINSFPVRVDIYFLETGIYILSFYKTNQLVDTQKIVKF